MFNEELLSCIQREMPEVEEITLSPISSKHPNHFMRTRCKINLYYPTKRGIKVYYTFNVVPFKSLDTMTVQYIYIGEKTSEKDMIGIEISKVIRDSLNSNLEKNPKFRFAYLMDLIRIELASSVIKKEKQLTEQISEN